MPRQDGTGPLGQGPMTGRKRGVCRSNQNRTESIVKYADLAGRLFSGILNVFQSRPLKNHSARQIIKR